MSRFDLARRALGDLQDIWEYVSEDSFDPADRVLISRDVLFWPVHSYLVIYRASNPLRIVRVIHGKRDVKKLLKKR